MRFLTGTALMNKDHLGGVFRRLLKRAGLSPHRVYDLRHTYASLLLADGAPLTYVSAQLGHANPTTTLRHYARWMPKKGKRWVNALDKTTSSRFVEPKSGASAEGG
jgi:integrase